MFRELSHDREQGKTMTDASATSTKSVLIVGGDSGAGLAAVYAAARAGYTVVATNESGVAGTYRIRAAGGIPVTADITREGELRSAMALAGAQVVINMAAQRVLQLPQVHVDLEKLGQMVEDATESLVLAAGKMGVKRLVHLSAAYLYGDVEHDPVNEDAPVSRANALFKSLERAEHAIFDGGIAGYVLRSGYVYGGWSEACATLAADLRHGKGVAQGHGMAAWIHEEDLAAAAVKLLDLGTDDEATANVLNIADNTPASHHAFMSKFGAAFGTGEPYALSGLAAQFRTSPLQREMLELNTRMDCSKIKALLNWKPAYSQESGLDRMTMVWRATESSGSAAETAGAKGLVKA
jgi:nucleoside-diphosphate-sugar epimerase